MKHKFLQIAGVDNEEAFYKKYPSEAAFFKAHPEAMGKQKKWKKGANGLTIPTKDTNPYFGTDRPFDTGEPLDPKTALRNQMFLNTELPNEDPTLPKLQPFQQPIPSSLDLRIPGAQIPQQEEFPLVKKLDPFQVPIPSSKDLRTPGATINPNYKGQRPKDKKPYSPDLSNGIAAGLSLIDAAIPKGDTSRKYVRPEDQLSYNPLPYGTGSQAIMKKGGKMKKCAEGMTMPGLTGQFYARETGVKAKKFPDGGKQKGKQKGKQAPQPIVVNNPNDPRLRAYQDSLRNNNNFIQADKLLSSQPNVSRKEDGNKVYYNAPTGNGKDFLPQSLLLNNGVDYRGIEHEESYYGYSNRPNTGTWSAPISKKPVQPVVYQQNNQPPLKTGRGYDGHWRDENGTYWSKDPQAKDYKVQSVPKPKPEPQLQKPSVTNVPLPQAQGMQGAGIRPIPVPDMTQRPTNFTVDNHGTPQYFQSYDQWKNFVDKNNLSSKQEAGDKSSAQANYFAEGGPLKKGKKVTIMSYADGGGVTPLIGGKAPQISHNPIDGGMGEFQGRSHEDGGIKATFAGKPFEAEGGEPYRIDNQGSLEIFGQLKNPLTGSTFKKDAKVIAKKEQRVQKYIDLGTELVNSTPRSKDMFEVMKMNSGQAMMKGGLAKQKELADAKEHLSTLQDMMLQVTSPDKAANGGKYARGGTVDPTQEYEDQKKYAEETIKNPKGHYKWEIDQAKEFLKNPKDFYKNLISYNTNQLKQGNKDSYLTEEINTYNTILKNLSTPKKTTNIQTSNSSNNNITPINTTQTSNNQVQTNSGKPWQFKGTKTDKLDEKIKAFVKLAEDEGLTGYSGAKGGYDVRNTKSGRPSRHASNQALDMIFSNPDAYQTILKNPKLSAYLYNNGLTAINEYDPTIAGKTGATAGHIHIGYDKGTKTADAFRNEYKSLYNPTAQAPTVYSPLSKPFSGKAPSGDAQTENPDYWTPENKWNFNGTKSTTTPAPLADVHTPFNFTNPPAQNPQDLKSPFPWEQTIPLIPALIDRTDPVKMQKFSPDLYSPYSVSFQDQRNRNTAQLRGVQTATAYDPTAQAVLGAQAYSANNQIDAEEFRTNQGIFNDVLNKNVSLLNVAKTANLQLGDTQYTHQTQAQANTRDRRTEGLVALTDLIAKNQLENKTLGVAKNLFKDYTFDKNGTLQYVGADINERMAGVPTGTATQKTKSEVSTKVGNTTTKDTYQPIQDFTGMIKKALRKPYKSGGKVTQNTIAKLMYS